MGKADAGSQLVQGSLDMLILRALRDGPLHGYAITRFIQSRSADVLRVEEGSLYPALHRMEARGWIRGTEGTSENNRRARFYRLRPAGRRTLAVESEHWARVAGAVSRVIEPV